MWVIVHTFVSLVIGAALHLPRWALTLIVLGSHVPLDLIPHWDYIVSRRHEPWAWADSLAARGDGALLLAHPGCAACAGRPESDLRSARPRCPLPHHQGGDDKGWLPSHWGRFPHGTCAPVPGIAVQAAIVAACAAILIAAWG